MPAKRNVRASAMPPPKTYHHDTTASLEGLDASFSTVPINPPTRKRGISSVHSSANSVHVNRSKRIKHTHDEYTGIHGHVDGQAARDGLFPAAVGYPAFLSECIIYGSYAERLPERERCEFASHRWTAYVRSIFPPGICSVDGQDANLRVMTTLIERVQFRLHESFAEPIRWVHQAPFEIHERGWGEFVLHIEIFIRGYADPFSTCHTVKLHPFSDDFRKIYLPISLTDSQDLRSGETPPGPTKCTETPNGHQALLSDEDEPLDAVRRGRAGTSPANQKTKCDDFVVSETLEELFLVHPPCALVSDLRSRVWSNFSLPAPMDDASPAAEEQTVWTYAHWVEHVKNRYNKSALGRLSLTKKDAVADTNALTAQATSLLQTVQKSVQTLMAQAKSLSSWLA